MKNKTKKNVCGVGIIGSEYPSRTNGKMTKEYNAWIKMLHRCYDDDIEQGTKGQTHYKDIIVCEEWLYFPNFYEWLHKQENFDKWFNGNRWNLDKDILIKGNKLYSPKTCCLVPHNVNNLFVKCDAKRGKYPIGVHASKNKFRVYCRNSFTGKVEGLGTYKSIEEAFNIYKNYKEKIIKQVAKKEYSNGNITEKCYNAMMNYKVEITD